jgi:hypothetical protein
VEAVVAGQQGKLSADANCLHVTLVTDDNKTQQYGRCCFPFCPPQSCKAS